MTVIVPDKKFVTINKRRRLERNEIDALVFLKGKGEHMMCVKLQKLRNEGAVMYVRTHGPGDVDKYQFLDDLAALITSSGYLVLWGG